MMIQDIYPKKLDIAYVNRRDVKEGDILLVYSRAGVLLGGNRPPKVGEIAGISDIQYLFAIDDVCYFLYAADADFIVPEGMEFVSLHDMRSRVTREVALACATGWHLYNWYKDNKFCGRCSMPTVHHKELRAMQCPECGNLIFPRISPAVIVAVKNGDKLLLTKYKNRPYTRYALIAGFTEIGETLEDTVRREVKEEAGVDVKNITYYGSQPWGFDGNILMGFNCELDGSDEIKMDDEELSVAQWIDRADVPDYDEGLAITHELMKNFKYEK